VRTSGKGPTPIGFLAPTVTTYYRREGAENMIGHLALFVAVLVAAALVALAYPSPTGSDACRAATDANAFAASLVTPCPGIR
jgi:hypothetical protein